MTINGVDYEKEFSVFVKDDPIAGTGAIIRPDEIYEGDSVRLYATPVLQSGRTMSSDSCENYFVSKNKDIATIEGDILTAYKTGTVTIEVTSVFNGNVVRGTTDIEIEEAGMTSLSITAGGSKIIRLTDKEYDSVPLYVTATDNHGNEIDLSDAEIVSETLSDTVTIDGNNEIYPISEGEAVFNVTVTLPNGRMRSTSATLRVSRGKSKSTYYTPEEIAIARENYKNVDWVKNTYKSYIANADKYVENCDVLYSLIPSEGIPRAICLGEYTDPLAYVCRYCNTDLMAKFGQFPWLHSPIQRPWKIQCP
ncbi:MAG: hypothetical protein IKU43_09965, partial [Clostridia bacterium]|nr:hypothetical protein [Clostridia bacterium]